MFLSSFSINLQVFYYECRPLIGYATHVLLCDRYTQGDRYIQGRYIQVQLYSLQNLKIKVLVRTIMFHCFQCTEIKESEGSFSANYY